MKQQKCDRLDFPNFQKMFQKIVMVTVVYLKIILTLLVIIVRLE